MQLVQSCLLDTLFGKKHPHPKHHFCDVFLCISISVHQDWQHGPGSPCEAHPCHLVHRRNQQRGMIEPFHGFTRKAVPQAIMYYGLTPVVGQVAVQFRSRLSHMFESTLRPPNNSMMNVHQLGLDESVRTM